MQRGLTNNKDFKFFPSENLIWQQKIKHEFFIDINNNELDCKKYYNELKEKFAAEKSLIATFIKAYLLFCIKAPLSNPFLPGEWRPFTFLQQYEQTSHIEELVALENRLLISPDKEKLLHLFMDAMIDDGVNSKRIGEIVFDNKAFVAMETNESNFQMINNYIKTFKIDYYVKSDFQRAESLLKRLLGENDDAKNLTLTQGENFLAAVILKFIAKFDLSLSARIIINIIPKMTKQISLPSVLVTAAANFSCETVKAFLENKIDFDKYGEIPISPRLGPFRQWSWIICPLGAATVNFLNLAQTPLDELSELGLTEDYKKERFVAAKNTIKLLLSAGANPDNQLIGTDDGMDGIQAQIAHGVAPMSARSFCVASLLQFPRQAHDDQIKDILDLILLAPEKSPAPNFPFKKN